MSVPGPVLGPCESWITGDDVAACCGLASNPASYDDVALEASMLLFELSGRLWPGLCTRLVRPCRTRNPCWTPYVYGVNWAYVGWSGSAWESEMWGGGALCGCSPLQKVKLAGYPVREVTEVKINGDVVDPTSYRLDGWRWLVRLADPGPPVSTRYWPACQNLALDDTEDGTWSVEYSWGVSPPPLGISAAAELACELYRACAGEACSLPANATRVVRQGIEIERTALLTYLGTGQASGLPLVDAFVGAYGLGFLPHVTGRAGANARRAARRPAVWTPDVPGFPKRVG